MPGFFRLERGDPKKWNAESLFRREDDRSMALLSMSEPGQARTANARYRDRRVDERFEINEPGGCLNYKGSKYPCLIVDVSLSGCCVRTESKFLPGNLANVEVVLPLLGMVLRMVGTTQWLTRENLIGIRFFHANARSKNQLAGLFTCLVDQSATEEVRAAVVAAARSGTTALDVELPELWLQPEQSTPKSEPVQEDQMPPAASPAADQSSYGGESGVRNPDDKEWPALLRFLKDGSHQNGAIIGLNQDGCCIQTCTPFLLGIHVRVEVDFQMRGLPFLLAGVVEGVYDKRTVDIRFQDMSYRKRGELMELMAEMREEAKKKSKAK